MRAIIAGARWVARTIAALALLTLGYVFLWASEGTGQVSDLCWDAIEHLYAAEKVRA